MTWYRWQRFCGWLALVTATIWATKFALLTATNGDPGAFSVFTGFLAPTSGSLLGLVAATGVVAPFLSRCRWWVGLPLSAVTGLLVVAFASAVTNGSSQLPFVVASTSPVLRMEAPIVAASIFWLLVAAWLLRPSLHSGAAAVLLLIGGALWAVKAVAVVAGASIDGWVVVVYQAGLWALLVSAAWLGVRSLRDRKYPRVVIALPVTWAAMMLGSASVLRGELGVFSVGLLAVCVGVGLVHQSTSGGTSPHALPA